MKPPHSPGSAFGRVQSAPGNRSPTRGDAGSRHASAAIAGLTRAGSGSYSAASRRGGTASKVLGLGQFSGFMHMSRRFAIFEFWSMQAELIPTVSS